MYELETPENFPAIKSPEYLATKHTDWIKDMCNCSDIINDPEYRDDYNRKEYQENEGNIN